MAPQKERGAPSVGARRSKREDAEGTLLQKGEEEKGPTNDESQGGRRNEEANDNSKAGSAKIRPLLEVWLYTRPERERRGWIRDDEGTRPAQTR